MSARAAAIEAGWIKEPTSLEKIRKLIPKLTAAECQRIIPDLFLKLTPTQRRQLIRQLEMAAKKQESAKRNLPLFERGAAA
jgi:hypothetical protein